MHNKRQIGSEYEIKAAEYLRSIGCEILAMNYHCRAGEIDIIAKDKEYLVFCEVKYRKDARYGYPVEAVDYHKVAKIQKTSRYFLMMEHYSEDTPVRFDIIAYLGAQIEHIKDAF